MQQRHLPILLVLDRLREKGDSAVDVAGLLDQRYDGHIPRHTGGGVFGDAICKLVDSGFIRVFNEKGQEISHEIEQIGEKGDWTLKRGYKVADFLRGREKELRVALTSRLGAVQSVLGVSITKLIEDSESHDTVLARPLFGRPSGSPSADVFVLMPFREDLAPVYDDHIRAVCEKLKLSCKRADDIFGSTKIIDDIWELIANSSTIVADCTDRNPNVFYELGIAHTLGKKVVLITQSSEDVPFDIKHIRHIKYSYTPRGMKEFDKTLEGFLE